MTIKKTFRIIVYILAVIGFFVIFNNSSSSTNTVLVVGSLVILLLILLKTINKRKKKETTLPTISTEKERHYQKLGMEEQQVLFFRETMATAKKQVMQLETNMHSVAKLKAIDLRNDAVKAAKAMFKELVKAPTKLHQADRFLYNHLPNLVDLTNKYLEINGHDIKTKNTYDALEKSSQVIDDVSQLLVSDYEAFMADDLDDLDVEITLAQQNISREKNKFGETTEFSNEEEEF